jgi:hypothetical protein
MRNESRDRHAEMALTLAARDQRLLDTLQQRPYLLNPYPSLLTRMSRRSRRFKQRLATDRDPRRDVLRGRIFQAGVQPGLSPPAAA